MVVGIYTSLLLEPAEMINFLLGLQGRSSSGFKDFRVLRFAMDLGVRFQPLQAVQVNPKL